MAASQKIKLGLLQTWADPDPVSNLKRTLQLAHRAADQGAQIISTQELFRSPYFCQSEDHANFALAEEIPGGPSTQAFCELAKARGVVVVASLFERRTSGVYHNTAAVIDADGSYLGSYRKMHIPDDPLFYEKFYFTPGDLGFKTWNTRFGRIGVLICWDQWFPEAARLTAMSGAEILFYPTAIGWHPSEREKYGEAHHSSWETIQRAHDVTNGCYVAVTNRIGHERPVGGDGIKFWGQSFIANTSGQIIAKAGAEQEEVLVHEIDLAAVEVTRTHWPFLRDRRIDAYGGLTRRLIDENSYQPGPRMSALSSHTPATPRALGFRMPAEWARHDTTWLTWPRPDGISFPDAFDDIPALWAGLAKLLAGGEQVHINVFSPEHETDIRAALKKAEAPVDSRIHLHPFPAYEPWCRDHGPIFVRNEQELAVVDWRYNAWGGKYPPCDLDDDVPQHVAKLLGLRLFSPPMILEGGSIEVNGEGALLTTEACLLNKNRNPDLTQKEIEGYLRDYLGVEQILWLGEGIVGDDTDGHIDDLTRFVSADTLVTIVEDDPADENYALLRENSRRLAALRDPRGRPWRIVNLPTPGRIEREGQRLPASYANFYIANEVVVMPAFNHPNDAKAREILQKLFPTRRVVAWPALDLIWGLGAFHCITQQQPAF